MKKIKAWAKYPDFRYVIENGVALCRECHKLTDNYKGKQNGFYIECKNNSYFKLKCNKIIFGHYHVTHFFL